VAESGPAQYNPTHGSQADFESHAGDGPQRRQKGWEKGSENAGGGSYARAAESDCPKSSKDSMGQSKEKALKRLMDAPMTFVLKFPLIVEFLIKGYATLRKFW
jgi:hypothetical protein